MNNFTSPYCEYSNFWSDGLFGPWTYKFLPQPIECIPEPNLAFYYQKSKQNVHYFLVSQQVSLNIERQHKLSKLS